MVFIGASSGLSMHSIGARVMLRSVMLTGLWRPLRFRWISWQRYLKHLVVGIGMYASVWHGWSVSGLAECYVCRVLVFLCALIYGLAGGMVVNL